MFIVVLRMVCQVNYKYEVIKLDHSEYIKVTVFIFKSTLSTNVSLELGEPLKHYLGTHEPVLEVFRKKWTMY